MRELSRTDAPALRALAALCLSDPSNPVNPGYGVTAEDVARFWLDDSREALHDTHLVLRSLRLAGYVRPTGSRTGRLDCWTPTARGWQAALMPSETVDERA